MTIHAAILSDLHDGPDPEGEKYLDRHDEWPWYTLKDGLELTEDLEAHLQDLGYIDLGKEDGFIYDEISDHRTEFHKSVYGNNDSKKAEILAWYRKNAK